MQELKRGNLAAIIRPRVRWVVDGLAEEPVVVWFRRLKYADLATIEGIVKSDASESEQVVTMAQFLSDSVYDGDTDTLLWSVDEAVALPVSAIQALAKGLIAANGAGTETKSTDEAAKNESSDGTSDST